MLSRVLRAVLLVQALLLVLAGWRLPPAAAAHAGPLLRWVAGLVLGLVLLNALVLGLAHLVVRALGGGAAAGTLAAKGRGGALRALAGEWLALLALYLVLQPFARQFLGREAVAPPRSDSTPPSEAAFPPVLLVHGYLCNRGVWWCLRRRLRARGLAVATLDLEPLLGDLDSLAARLGEGVDALLRETRAPRALLVTHSMGGLVARAYLRQAGAARVAGLVTLAAPHQGTAMARLGLGRNARQMQPDSDWLRELAAAPVPPIPRHSIWSRDDRVLVPPATAHWEGASETVLDGVGHMALLFSSRAMAAIERELARS